MSTADPSALEALFSTPADESADHTNGGTDGPTSGPLFEGDAGTLTLAERRALVALIKRHFVSIETTPEDWATVNASQHALRSRLNDLFLELVVDIDNGVAYKRPAIPLAGGRFPGTLLHDRSYTREETILLFNLRRALIAADADAQDVALVDRDTLVEEITYYHPEDATDRVKIDKAARSAVEQMLAADVLIKTNQHERYRVSRVVASILTPEALTDIRTWLSERTETTSGEEGTP